MKSNSVAHIYLKDNTVIRNQTIKTGSLGLEIYDSHLLGGGPLNLSDLTSVLNKSYVTLDNSSTISDYTITAKNNIQGFYGLTLNPCGLSPFAVGINDTAMNPVILLKFLTAVYSCPAMPYSSPDIVNMSGIISKHITIDFTKLSQLKQQQVHISSKDVTCKQGFELIIKKVDKSPACVKPQTAQILVERQWGNYSNLVN
jgi:hypothetical protein